VTLRIVGVALIAIGSIVNIGILVQFSLEGFGLPFPTDRASSRQVMVGGPYRYVRNPMYGSYMIAVVGQALLLTRPVLLIYAGALLAALMLLVRLYEERMMAKRFGSAYQAYRASVPGWWPRLRRHPDQSQLTTAEQAEATEYEIDAKSDSIGCADHDGNNG
jgi:protein-S-isoprenylcysteine O-methyltransferase Ste14